MQLIFAILVVLGVGYGIKYFLDYRESEYRITPVEYIAGALICGLLVVPLTLHFGTKWAKASKLTYYEFWGGFEREAQWDKTACSKDGGCQNSYNCDPYTHTHTRSVPNADGKGSHLETYTETHYHHCPYVDQEWTFRVDTTLGDYTVAAGWFPDNPEAHRWTGKGWERHGLSGFHSGIPQVWAEAKARIDSGYPGGAQAVKTYDNYILASQRSILKRYGKLADGYLKQGLLPKPVSDTVNEYQANKVYFVGTAPENRAEWQEAALRFTGALGTEKQGDLHLVIVNDARVQDEDDYINGLMAYWQGKQLGKHAVSKNAVVVVLGTHDGKYVAWARAATGMPRGNEAFTLEVKNKLSTGKVALDPIVILGKPKVTHMEVFGKKKAVVTHTSSVLEQVVWGDKGFTRLSMTCNDPDEKCVGFKYLKNEIQPSSGQKFVMLLVALLLSLLIWSVFVALGPVSYARSEYGRGPGDLGRYTLR